MSLVLDSSATLAWVYGDETSEAIRRVFDQLSSEGAWVPSLWRLEVAHVLEMGVRRRRHDRTFRDATLADLWLLPVQVDGETDWQAWGETLRLAERHRLPMYAAACLELAMRAWVAAGYSGWGATGGCWGGTGAGVGVIRFSCGGEPLRQAGMEDT